MKSDVNIAGEKLAIRDMVGLGVVFCVLDGLGHIFNPDDFSGFPADELGDGSSACIEVINRLGARQGRKFTRHTV